MHKHQPRKTGGAERLKIGRETQGYTVQLIMDGRIDGNVSLMVTRQKDPFPPRQEEGTSMLTKPDSTDS